MSHEKEDEYVRRFKTGLPTALLPSRLSDKIDEVIDEALAAGRPLTDAEFLAKLGLGTPIKGVVT